MVLRTLVYILLLALMLGGYGYFSSYHPEMVKELLITVDKFGITRTGKEEQVRIAKINALPITYEKKQVLINRTVFLNADINMVYLALGQPREMKRTILEGGGNEAILLIYHFSDDKRPTILQFEEEKLTSAYKGSVLEVYSQNQ